MIKLPTQPGYVHEGSWPYPNTDVRRAYMRKYNREHRVRNPHTPMTAEELRAYKTKKQREYRK